MDIAAYNDRFLNIQGKLKSYSITHSEYSILKSELDLVFINDPDSHTDFKKELIKAIEDRESELKSRLESERRMEITRELMASKRTPIERQTSGKQTRDLS